MHVFFVGNMTLYNKFLFVLNFSFNLHESILTLPCSHYWDLINLVGVFQLG
jgi:hypothetical protein